MVRDNSTFSVELWTICIAGGQFIQLIQLLFFFGSQKQDTALADLLPRFPVTLTSSLRLNCSAFRRYSSLARSTMTIIVPVVHLYPNFLSFLFFLSRHSLLIPPRPSWSWAPRRRIRETRHSRRATTPQPHRRTNPVLTPSRTLAALPPNSSRLPAPCVWPCSQTWLPLP